MSTLQCPTTLLLARHAEAEYEAAAWSTEGGCLTRRGRNQSAELAARVAARRVAHVWTSTLSRAVQTGEIAAAELGVGVTTRHGLREFDPGELAVKPRDTDLFAPTYAAWLAGNLDVRIPGGESGLEVVARIEACLDEIADQHPGETVLVVGHGGSLRLAVPLLARMDVTPGRLVNGAVVEVRVDADDRVCVAWDHLQAAALRDGA